MTVDWTHQCWVGLGGVAVELVEVHTELHMCHLLTPSVIIVCMHVVWLKGQTKQSCTVHAGLVC